MILGFFALINANEQHGENSVANMNSPIFEMSDETFCIHFWFYASAPNIGSLNIRKVRANNNKSKLLWSFLTSESTEVSDVWQEGQVQYVVSIRFFFLSFFHDGFFKSQLENSAMFLTIQAIMGPGEEGGFAIDDITIDQRSCESRKIPIIQ